MIMTAQKSLNNGMQTEDLGRLAMMLWERIMYPKAELEDYPHPDTGFMTVAQKVINMEVSSETQAVATTVPQLAEELRITYRDAENRSRAEPTALEKKAWIAVARFLAYAVQTQTSEQAGQMYDQILAESK